MTRDELDGPDPRAPLRAHAAALLASMACGRVPLDQWMLTFPASARASDLSYVRHVDTHHPWIADLQPRVHDVAWLTAVAGVPAQPSRNPTPNPPRG